MFGVSMIKKGWYRVKSLNTSLRKTKLVSMMWTQMGSVSLLYFKGSVHESVKSKGRRGQ